MDLDAAQLEYTARQVLEPIEQKTIAPVALSETEQVEQLEE
jgi:hypothetical protein